MFFIRHVFHTLYITALYQHLPVLLRAQALELVQELVQVLLAEYCRPELVLALVLLLVRE
jgi:hypothetical protein